MPFVNIKVTDEGVTTEQKQQLIQETTDMLFRVLGKPHDSTFVVIDEIGLDNWGASGKTVTELRR